MHAITPQYAYKPLTTDVTLNDIRINPRRAAALLGAERAGPGGGV